MLNFLISTTLTTLLFAASGEKAVAEDCQCSQLKPVAQVLPTPFITKEIIVRYFPTNMTPTPDSNLFMVQFGTGLGQKISEDIMRGSLFRQSALGKLTDKVEKASQTSVNLGNAGGTQVKIDFQVKVIERQAVLSYKGLISSEIIYAIDQQSLKWVTSRALSKATSLAWTNVAAIGSANISSSILSLSRAF